MDRLSDAGSIPARSIIKKPWKSLISGVFLLLGNVKICRFRLFQTGSK